MITRTRHDDRIAIGWGFAEALLFFVIPDVFLTLMALRRGTRRSLRLAILAAAGAVAGGLLAYGWGAVHAASALGVMELLPGIDRSMIDAVRGDVVAEGNQALLFGPWRGQPYKLFAVASGELGLSAVGLAMLTMPGRLARFVVSVGFAGYVRWLFGRWVSERVLVTAWALFWVVVYAGYWLA